ncbi:apolipoprotein N-acyltransferase [Thiotrichales bacterium 19S9-12]|nr:apolipoprotein N-acyltransferase [Thiotrichales bacterium 19S9-11]MCF6812413.1 apolipoprotein N-acyltransferase [Thiotrichales bacterium 19S9-12]
MKSISQALKNKWIYLSTVSILSLLSGCLLTLSFAPYELWFFAFVALLVPFYLWSISYSGKMAFWVGFLFGIGNFGTGIYWIYVSIYTYGNTSALLAISITSLFVIVLALFPAIVGFINQKLCSKKNNSYQLCFIYPATWALFEWIRSWLLTGFPWLFVGYTQTNTYLGGLAEIGSVYLVSFAVCLCVSAILMFIHTKQIKAKAVAIILVCIIWLLGYYSLQDQKWTVRDSQPLSVSLIQGNIKPMMKWDPTYLRRIQDTYFNLTQSNPADLIFWPENSIPIFPQYNQAYLNAINQFALAHDSAILIGSPIGSYDGPYYNGAFVKGYGYGKYYKQHLVPFGEYLPLRSLLLPIVKWMDQPMTEFSAGQKDQDLINMKGIDVALFICYEIAFPNIVRQQSESAGLIVTITDDGWFGDTTAPWQHLQMTHMRAIENGKFIIQATNDGISAIITPNKVITYPQFKQGVLKGTVYAMEGQTPWVRYGILPVLMLVSLSLILGIVIRRRQRKK